MWKRFDGEELPPALLKLMQDADCFRSGHGCWLIGTVWYKGYSLEEATEWVVVMDDGGYYKVWAEYSFWHSYTGTNPEYKDKLVLQCVWSAGHLKKTVRNFLEYGETLPDPGYQT